MFKHNLIKFKPESFEEPIEDLKSIEEIYNRRKRFLSTNEEYLARNDFVEYEPPKLEEMNEVYFKRPRKISADDIFLGANVINEYPKSKLLSESISSFTNKIEPRIPLRNNIIHKWTPENLALKGAETTIPKVSKNALMLEYDLHFPYDFTYPCRINYGI